MDVERLSTRNLLALHAEIARKLRSRGICRSANSPVADYAEWLCSKRLGLTLVSNSTAGYDATDPKGRRYEIKARRRTAKSIPSHFSAIRGLANRHFDLFIGIVFAEDFSVERAASLPFRYVSSLARYRKHVNGSILYLRDFWSSEKAEDLTRRLRVG